MNIGIDESGSFVYTDALNSWNCVVAYAYPEAHSRRIRNEVRNLVWQHAEPHRREVKLRHLSEDEYAEFLHRLQRFDGVCYSVATNAAANTPVILDRHQQGQVRKILEHVDGMIYESGREGVRELARRVERLPHQLYVQMICQVQLVLQILLSAILFFVQRYPPTLGRFRWRIDQKNSRRTDYETAYSQVLPAFLQSASLREPMPKLEGANYRWFERLYFPEGEEPTYLRDNYGIEVEDAGDRKINLGQLVGEDVLFVDSRSDAGVQIADLLASGLRRCLRNQFTSNENIASLLGGLMVQKGNQRVPVQLIGLGTEEGEVDEDVSEPLYAMRAHARGMLAR
jgi:hypothetical protein